MTVPAGPDAKNRAEKLRDDLIHSVETGTHPKTDGNVDQLMAAYLDETKKLGRKTLDGCQGNHRKHISLLLGRFKINGGQVDEDLIDQFYSELERCRDHCGVPGARPAGKHWTPLEHRCDRRCKPHVCDPLSPATIHKIHSQLNGAFKYAKRKKWVIVNPFEGVEPPPVPKGCPQPPSVKETALIIDAAWNGTYYGPAVWFASTTGARLGELCALRWRSIEQVGVQVWEKGTKTHQHRRIALDSQDAAVLIDLRQTREEEGKRAGRAVLETDFIIPSRVSRSNTASLALGQGEFRFRAGRRVQENGTRCVRERDSRGSDAGSPVEVRFSSQVRAAACSPVREAAFRVDERLACRREPPGHRVPAPPHLT
jgi:integrase